MTMTKISESPLQYLQIYFRASYYVGIFPFKLQLNSQTDSYELVTNAYQKILCGLNLALCLLEELRDGIDIIQKMRSSVSDERSNPETYFELANLFSNLVYYSTIVMTQWFRKTQILGLFNVLHKGHSKPRKSKAGFLAPLSILTFAAYIGLAILVSFSTNFWNGPMIWEFWAQDGMELFLLPQGARNFSGHGHEDGGGPIFLLVTQITFGTLRMAVLIAYSLMTSYGEVLLINCALCLGDVCDDLRIMAQDPNIPAEEILEQYEFVKSVSKAMNKAVGVLVFGVVMGSLPYFVSNFVSIVQPDDIFMFLIHLLEFFNIYTFMVLAANVNKKLDALDDWLMTSKTVTSISLQELTPFLHDLSRKCVGIQGAGFFTVNSTFLGSMISLLLTFSVILIQFKTPSRPCPLPISTIIEALNSTAL